MVKARTTRAGSAWGTKSGALACDAPSGSETQSSGDTSAGDSSSEESEGYVVVARRRPDGRLALQERNSFVDVNLVGTAKVRASSAPCGRHDAGATLRLWQLQECDLLDGHVGGYLEPSIRGTALRLLSMMRGSTAKGNEAPNLWFRSVQLLDLTSGDLAGCPGRAMPRAMAAFEVSLQLELTLSRRAMGDVLQRLAGSVPHAVLSKASDLLADIARERAVIREALAGDLASPTVISWVDRMLSFSAELCGSACNLSAVRGVGLVWAERLVWQCPVSPAHPPRTSALGICCCLLVGLGVLQAKDLCPAHLDQYSWAETFASVIYATGLQPVAGFVPPRAEQAADLLQSLADVCGCGVGQLQATTLAVLDVLRMHFAPAMPAMAVKLSA